MSDNKRFMAPGPWVTRDLKECVLASDYDALQKSFELECGDVDTLLVLLQLNPHDYRSDAGWLLLHKIHGAIVKRDAAVAAAEREACADKAKAMADSGWNGWDIADAIRKRGAL